MAFFIWFWENRSLFCHVLCLVLKAVRFCRKYTGCKTWCFVWLFHFELLRNNFIRCLNERKRIYRYIFNRECTCLCDLTFLGGASTQLMATKVSCHNHMYFEDIVCIISFYFDMWLYHISYMLILLSLVT